jgi:hypothetical protein
MAKMMEQIPFPSPKKYFSGGRECKCHSALNLDPIASSPRFSNSSPGTLGNGKTFNHRNSYYCYSNAFSLLPLLGRKLLDAWYLEQKEICPDKVFSVNLFSLVSNDEDRFLMVP